MVPDDTSAGASPDWARIALIGCCVFATVVAATLVPALATDNLAGTPIDSILPGDRFENASAGPAGGEAPGTGFGALNPGDTTGVGGDTGFDNDTFGSNDTEVHFEVESSEPAYWRTGAYDTYTGSGWERTGDLSTYRSPISHDGIPAERVDFEITLARPASALPVVWRPRAITGVDGISVTDSRGLRLDEYVEAGTTISGVSRLPEDSVDVLRAAGQNYPNEIENRYTQLPDDTPERISQFTSELTADDETAYDVAMTVQNWLRTQKNYSLKASSQSDSIADTFIFEMDAGYCEYFATAMTTMLRSQDIPARYTVGYSTGQPIGNNTYEVRGMNAHAWVEVYFPEVGWVKFDPTPGGSRLQSQEDVLEEELGEDVDLQETGSPGEVFEPGEIREMEADRNETDETDTDGYDISLNRTAVPGLSVEVEVTYDGEAKGAMVVSFNGNVIGTTDGSGTVVGTVPEDEELRITVTNRTTEADSRQKLAHREPSTTGGWAATNQQPKSGGSTSQQSVFAQEWTLPPPASTVRQSQDDEANETYPIETTATVTVSGDVFPESNVTLTATVEGVAIPGAAVFVDGQQVTATDDAGRAQVTLPSEPGNVSVAVERGSVSGSTQLTIPELELTADTGSVVLPLGSVSVEVTAGDSTVAGAPIVVDGEEVAVTGPDGTATVGLPLAQSATIGASKYGMRDSVTVSGMLVNLAGLLVGVATVVLVPLYLVYRRGYKPRNVFSYLGSMTGLLGYGQVLLVRLAKNGDAWLVSGFRKLRQFVAYAVDVLRGRLSLREATDGVRRWFRERGRALRRRFGDQQQSADEDDDRLTNPNAHGVREAWEWLLTKVSVGDPGTRTPGELATHAIENDELPAKPVRTIRDAFRAVEYGSQPATAQLQRVQAAVERIEQTHEDRTQSQDESTGGRATTDGGRDDSGRPDIDPGESDGTAEVSE